MISRFEKEVIRSIFGHKNSWINFMEFWFLVLRRSDFWSERIVDKICDGWVKRNFMEFWFLRKKWFVRFLVIKIRGLISWNFDFRFEKEVIRSIFGRKESWMGFVMDGSSKISWNFDFWERSDSFDFWS